MAITVISVGCFLVLYCVVNWFQQPTNSSFTRELFTLRRPQLRIVGIHPDIFLWHTYTWFRWGLAAAIPLTLLDHLRRTNQISSQNPVFLMVQFVLFWIMALGILIGLYRIYCLLGAYFRGGIHQGLRQLWQAKWMQKLLGKPPKGEDVYLDLILDVQEAALGCEKTITLSHLMYCEACGGQGVLQGRRPHPCPSCLGAGYRSSDRQTPCTTCHGVGVSFSQECSLCQGSGQALNPKTITVQVPAGVKPPTRLRIAQKGQPAVGKLGLPGDLYIHLLIQQATE